MTIAIDLGRKAAKQINKRFLHRLGLDRILACFAAPLSEPNDKISYDLYRSVVVIRSLSYNVWFTAFTNLQIVLFI